MAQGSNLRVPTYIPSPETFGEEDDRQMINRIAKNLKWARLSLGGAVLGIAVAHALEAHFAPNSGVAVQSVGAISGTAIAAFVAKAVHIV